MKARLVQNPKQLGDFFIDCGLSIFKNSLSLIFDSEYPMVAIYDGDSMHTIPKYLVLGCKNVASVTKLDNFMAAYIKGTDELARFLNKHQFTSIHPHVMLLAQSGALMIYSCTSLAYCFFEHFENDTVYNFFTCQISFS